MEDLPSILQEAGLGIWFAGDYAGCLLYADDILLLASSADELNNMLELCDSFLSERGLALNHSKTQIIFHPHRGSCALSPRPLSFGGHTLEWSSTVIHLGHVIARDILDDGPDIERARLSLLTSAFQIVRAFHGAPPKLVAALVKSFSSHMYGIQLWGHNADLSSIAVAMNSVTSAIFGIPRRTHRCLFRELWPFCPSHPGLGPPDHSCAGLWTHSALTDFCFDDTISSGDARSIVNYVSTC
jgi:hypothetical protein